MRLPTGLVGALLGARPHIINWGWLQITLANLVVVVLMIAVFIAALVAPFPGRDK